MKLYRGRHVALQGAVLGALAGIGLSGAAHHAGANAATRPSTVNVVRYHTMRPTGTRYPPGTVVRLRQRRVDVTIHNFAFHPARLVVSPGTRIVWTNQDSDPHTVQSTKGIWASEALDTGQRFARLFSKIGAFSYYCSIHPFMHGTITVTK